MAIRRAEVPSYSSLSAQNTPPAPASLEKHLNTAGSHDEPYNDYRRSRCYDIRCSHINTGAERPLRWRYKPILL